MQGHPVGAGVMGVAAAAGDCGHGWAEYKWPGLFSSSHLPLSPRANQMVWEPGKWSLQWQSKGCSEFIFQTSNWSIFLYSDFSSYMKVWSIFLRIDRSKIMTGLHRVPAILGLTLGVLYKCILMSKTGTYCHLQCAGEEAAQCLWRQNDIHVGSVLFLLCQNPSTVPNQKH